MSESAHEPHPPISRSGRPPIDFQRLHLVAETPQEKAAILALFFRTGKQFILTMTNSLANETFEPWRKAAHTLKGSAGNLGMTALAALCLQAEKVENLREDEHGALLVQIRAEMQHIRAYVAYLHPSFLNIGI